ncbi:YsnF/AvaK domain-containing protein [Streptomyces termitum]
MITQEQIPTVLDHPVHDAEGKKIGDARHVFVDDATGQPEWVTVKTGLFGTHESFVPIRDASVVGDHLEVPYPKDRVKDAPRVDVDGGGHLDAREEQRLYEYYGIAWDDAWQKANTPGEGGWAHGGAGGTGAAGTDTTGTAGAAGTTGTTGAAGTAGAAGAVGAAGAAGAAGAMGRDAGGREARADAGTHGAEDAMTRSEERMRVGTERVESGHVRLRKYVVTEEVQQTVPVRHEEVRVEREPITDANRDEALSGPEITEAEHEVVLHEERPVVETEAVPVERVRLTTDEVTEEETVTGQVRKERIEIEGDDTGGEGRRA